MRRFLLDTSVLTAFLLGRAGALSLLGPWISNHEAATSILVYGEVVEHISRRPAAAQLRTQLRQLLWHVPPFLLTYPIMERYADIRLRMRPVGGLIGDVDTLIAATALEQQLTVVTLDTDFGRVPGLQVQILTRQQLLSI